MADVLDPQVELLNPPVADNDLVTPHKSDLVGACDSNIPAAPSSDYVHDKEDSLDAEAAMSATDDAAKDPLLVNGTTVEAEPTPADRGVTDLEAHQEVTPADPSAHVAPTSAYSDATESQGDAGTHLGTSQQETVSDLPPAPSIPDKLDDSTPSEPAVDKSEPAPVASLEDGATVPTVESAAPVVTSASPATKSVALEEDVSQIPVTDAPDAPTITASEPEVGSQEVEAETKEDTTVLAPGTAILPPVPIEEHQVVAPVAEAKDDSEASASANGDAHETASSDTTADSANISQSEEPAESIVSPPQEGVVESAAEEGDDAPTPAVEDRTPSPEHASYIIQEVGEPAVEQIYVPTSYVEERTPTPQPELDRSAPVDKGESEDKPGNAYQEGGGIIPDVTEKGEESEAVAAAPVTEELEISGPVAESTHEEVEASAPITAEPKEDDQIAVPTVASEPKGNDESSATVVVTEPDQAPAAAVESAQEECEATVPASPRLTTNSDDLVSVPAKEEDVAPAEPEVTAPEQSEEPPVATEVQRAASPQLEAAVTPDADSTASPEPEPAVTASEPVTAEPVANTEEVVYADLKDEPSVPAAQVLPAETPVEESEPQAEVVVVRAETPVEPIVETSPQEDVKEEPQVEQEPVVHRPETPLEEKSEPIAATEEDAAEDSGYSASAAAELETPAQSAVQAAQELEAVAEPKVEEMSVAAEPQASFDEEKAVEPAAETEDRAVTAVEEPESDHPAPTVETATVGDDEETDEPASHAIPGGASSDSTKEDVVETIAEPEPELPDEHESEPVAPQADAESSSEPTSVPESSPAVVPAEDEPETHSVLAPAIAVPSEPILELEDTETPAATETSDSVHPEPSSTYEAAPIAIDEDTAHTDTPPVEKLEDVPVVHDQDTEVPAAIETPSVEADDLLADTQETVSPVAVSTTEIPTVEPVLTPSAETETPQVDRPEVDSEAYVTKDVPRSPIIGTDDLQSEPVPPVEHASEPIASQAEAAAEDVGEPTSHAAGPDSPRAATPVDDVLEPESVAVPATAAPLEPTPALEDVDTSDAVDASDPVPPAPSSPYTAAPVIIAEDTAQIETLPVEKLEEASVPQDQDPATTDSLSVESSNPLAGTEEPAPSVAIGDVEVPVIESAEAPSAEIETSQVAPSELDSESYVATDISHPLVTSTDDVQSDVPVAPQDAATEDASEPALLAATSESLRATTPAGEPEAQEVLVSDTPVPPESTPALEDVVAPGALDASDLTSAPSGTYAAAPISADEDAGVIETLPVEKLEEIPVAQDPATASSPNIEPSDPLADAEEPAPPAAISVTEIPVVEPVATTTIEHETPQAAPAEIDSEPYGTNEVSHSLATSADLQSGVSEVLEPPQSPVDALSPTTAEGASEPPLLIAVPESPRAATPAGDEPETQSVMNSVTAVSSEPILELEDKEAPVAVETSDSVHPTPSSTDETSPTTVDEDEATTHVEVPPVLGEETVAQDQDAEVLAASGPPSVEPSDVLVSTEEPVPPAAVNAVELPGIESAETPNAGPEAPQVTTSELESESCVPTEVSHLLISGTEEPQLDAPEVPSAEATAEGVSEPELLAAVPESPRAVTPTGDEQSVLPLDTAVPPEPVLELPDAVTPDTVETSDPAHPAPLSTYETDPVTTDEDTTDSGTLPVPEELHAPRDQGPATTSSPNIEPADLLTSAGEPVPPVVISAAEFPPVESAETPSADIETSQVAPSELGSDSYVTTEVSHSLVAGTDDTQSNVPEVSDSPRSPVGVLSPFDSRSEVSASSHVPVIPSSPRNITPALSEFDPAVKEASVVPEVGSPRQSPSPIPSEPSSIDVAPEVSPRDTTPVPDAPAPYALTEAAIEEHDDKLPEVTIEEQVAAQVPPVVISLADAPPTQDHAVGVEQDETKAASDFGYIPSEIATTEYLGFSEAGDIPSEAADSLSVVAEAVDEPEPEPVSEAVESSPVVEEYATPAGSLISSDTTPAAEAAPVKAAEEPIAAPAVAKPALAPIFIAPAPAPVAVALTSDADTADHAATADTPGAATPLDQATPTARSAPSSGDVFRTLQVDAEAEAASSPSAATTSDPSTSHPRLSITNEDGVEHDAPLSPTHDGRARLSSTASRHLPGGWVAQPVATPGEPEEVNAAGEISSPTTPRSKAAKSSCIIC